MSDRLSDYDYELPGELIAREPPPVRDAARLLQLDRETGAVEHGQFREFPSLLRPGDLLVLNETRVLPARLIGVRTATGGRWEGLFLREESPGRWRLIGKTRGRLVAGESITLHPAENPDAPERLTLTLLEQQHGGEWIASVEHSGDETSETLLDRFGTMPLPPYLGRDATAADRDRYQTTYARTPGSVAAPTAGLHFTPEVLSECRERGASVATVTLHVGIGTFRPISAEQLDDHVMHSEWCELPAETVAAIEQARRQGGRIIAVGTTTVRTLESVAARGPLEPWRGETDLFIRPGFTFRVIDAMVTNFHLPKSTLLALVSAFAGREAVLAAYAAAVEERYRFFSYGDAMFIAAGVGAGD